MTTLSYKAGYVDGYKAARHLSAERIAELEARTVLTHGTVDMMVTEYPKLRARIAELESENDELKNSLRKWRVALNQDGSENSPARAALGEKK